MPKVSIIIPVYNVEQYLKECLDSVVNQTYKDLEIICVDDCSKDNSIKIAEAFAQKDSRIKIVKHTNNQGLGPARNTGIDVATGEYLFFLDSDDYLELDIIELLHKKLVETQADLAFSQAIAFTHLQDKKSKKRICTLNRWLDCSSFLDYTVSLTDFLYSITNVNCVAWGKLYSKDFLVRNNIRFIDGKIIHEDNGFWLKICSQFPKVAFIQNIGVYYRIRENAITTNIDKKKNRSKKHKHMQLVLKDVFAYIQEYANPDLYTFFITQIKNSSEYDKYFYTKFLNLFKIQWMKNRKTITILGIPFFTEKLKGNKKVRKVLGIQVYKTNIKPLKIHFEIKPKLILDKKDSVMIFNTNNQDEQIKKALNELKEFFFLPNKGNLGDIIIAASEFQYLKCNGYNYHVFEIEKADKLKSPFNFVYGGGGIWHNFYKKDYKENLTVFKSPLLKKCVILPSSFYDCKDVISTFDERFTVFCREKQSLEYCKSLNSKANFILAEDMVVNANFDLFKESFYNSENLQNFKSEENLSQIIENYFKTLNIAKNMINENKDSNIGYFLREDSEGVLKYNNKVNTIDVSSFGGGCGRDIGLTFLLAKIFLSTIDKFDIVITDRLHVGICATKLGKQVLLLDNSYKKVSEVYKVSLAKYNNVKITTEEKLEEDIVICLNSSYKNNKWDLFKTLPLNIEEFSTQYASFKNEYNGEMKLW